MNRYRYEGRRRYNAENPEADRCSDGAIRATHCTGPQDESPEQRTYPTGYDSRCGWCYLNANHTQDEHTANVARHEARQQPPAPVPEYVTQETAYGRTVALPFPVRVF